MTTKQIPDTRHLRFKLLILLTPVAFALHNAEECMSGLPAWSFRNTGMDIYKSNGVFLLAVCILSFLVTLFTVMYYLKKTRPRLYVFSLVIAILGVNSVTHIIASVRYGAYTPGVATGLLLMLPLSIYYFTLAAKLNALTKRQIGATVFVGALIMVPLAYAALIASRYILQA